MRKTFKYRLYPSKKQVGELQKSLDACRWVYNETLALRKGLWKEKQESLSLYDTNKFLPQWKKDKPELSSAYAQCLQNAQLRVDLAYKAFFRRIRAGEKPGYPRFKSFDRYDSFTYPQSGFVLSDTQLRLSKIGIVKIRRHRETEGIIKTLTIRRTATGKWYACFSCEVQAKPLPVIDAVIGIDVGLKSFATLSTGEKIDNPRFFRKAEKTLGKWQRRLAKQKHGTPERKKTKMVVAHIHEKISNKRRDFAHKASRNIANSYQVIVLENLNIKSMLENNFRGIKKSIGDVAWNQFVQFTRYKAEEAGRTLVQVNPCNTSKRCSRCGQIAEKKLSERIHRCSCGLVLDRDHNAAINILALGMQSLSLD